LIGVGKASADCAFIADLHIAQLRGSFREQRADAAKKVRSLDLKVGGHGADAHLAAFFLDIREIFDLADVNEQRGLRKAKLHGGQETVSAGKKLGIVFMPGQERDGFIQAFGGNVIKICWDHESSPFMLLRLYLY
jgi:hypothetical protein